MNSIGPSYEPSGYHQKARLLIAEVRWSSWYRANQHNGATVHVRCYPKKRLLSSPVVDSLGAVQVGMLRELMRHGHDADLVLRTMLVAANLFP